MASWGVHGARLMVHTAYSCQQCAWVLACSRMSQALEARLFFSPSFLMCLWPPGVTGRLGVFWFCSQSATLWMDCSGIRNRCKWHRRNPPLPPLPSLTLSAVLSSAKFDFLSRVSQVPDWGSAGKGKIELCKPQIFKFLSWKLEREGGGGEERENSELRMFYCRRPLDPLQMVWL